jgi:hemerythrin-like domain-containing protein
MSLTQCDDRLRRAVLLSTLAAAMRDRVTTFTAEHRALEHAWEKLRPRLVAIGFGRPARLAIDEAARFATLYRNHVADEHQQLFAAAFGTEHPSAHSPSK